MLMADVSHNGTNLICPINNDPNILAEWANLKPDSAVLLVNPANHLDPAKMIGRTFDSFHPGVGKGAPAFLHLKGTAVNPSDFPKGSFVFSPLLDPISSLALTAIPADVMADLEAQGVFRDNAHTSPTDPQRPRIIRGRYPETLIGLYEGGGSADTEIYRPAGICKMRHTDYAWCYVCQYVLACLIWPDALNTVERNYPQ